MKVYASIDKVIVGFVLRIPKKTGDKGKEMRIVLCSAIK